MSRDDASLQDMLAAAWLASAFVTGQDKVAFLADVKTQSAVLHQLLILGEAAKCVSIEGRAAHPAVPWRVITGMRDIIIYDYDAVDLDEVWKTITSDIPDLVQALAAPVMSTDSEQASADARLTVKPSGSAAEQRR